MPPEKKQKKLFENKKHKQMFIRKRWLIKITTAIMSLLNSINRFWLWVFSYVEINYMFVVLVATSEKSFGRILRVLFEFKRASNVTHKLSSFSIASLDLSKWKFKECPCLQQQKLKQKTISKREVLLYPKQISFKISVYLQTLFSRKVFFYMPEAFISDQFIL